MIGIGEILIFGGVLVLIFGATQIPKIAKSLGEGLKEFKKSVETMLAKLLFDEKSSTYDITWKEYTEIFPKKLKVPSKEEGKFNKEVEEYLKSIGVKLDNKIQQGEAKKAFDVEEHMKQNRYKEVMGKNPIWRGQLQKDIRNGKKNLMQLKKNHQRKIFLKMF